MRKNLRPPMPEDYTNSYSNKNSTTSKSRPPIPNQEQNYSNQNNPNNIEKIHFLQIHLNFQIQIIKKKNLLKIIMTTLIMKNQIKKKLIRSKMLHQNIKRLKSIKQLTVNII